MTPVVAIRTTSHKEMLVADSLLPYSLALARCLGEMEQAVDVQAQLLRLGAKNTHDYLYRIYLRYNDIATIRGEHYVTHNHPF